jgi:hypothetical protein
LTDERSFDAVSAVFEAIGAGKTRIDRETFVDYFRRLEGGKRDDSQDEVQLRSMFDLIDADGRGTFSNFDLLGALQRFPAVASFLLPGIDRQRSFVMKLVSMRPALFGTRWLEASGELASWILLLMSIVPKRRV